MNVRLLAASLATQDTPLLVLPVFEGRKGGFGLPKRPLVEWVRGRSA